MGSSTPFITGFEFTFNFNLRRYATGTDLRLHHADWAMELGRSVQVDPWLHAG